MIVDHNRLSTHKTADRLNYFDIKMILPRRGEKPLMVAI